MRSKSSSFIFLLVSFPCFAQQPTPILADINRDGTVDYEDLFLVHKQWHLGEEHVPIVVSIPGLPEEAKSLESVLIPAGTFTMGSPSTELDRESDEGPQHQVTISKDFYLGRYEVTQAQWEALMGRNPSSFKGQNRPVEQVSWNDCQSFIDRLNAMALGTFRLPTEAEWEYACRAGTTTRFYWGDELYYTQIGDYAWYDSDSGSQSHDVGLKLPNAWGLYDMSGNVWEMCYDRYGGYTSSATVDPIGQSGQNLVTRGGSWYRPAWRCRSAERAWVKPSDTLNYVGFRVVLTGTP